METEVIQTVVSELLEEMKEVKLQQAELAKEFRRVTNQVATFDQKISNIKVWAPPVDTSSIKLSVEYGISKLAATIEAKPKKVVKEFRILLFPEYGAREYYKLVFGRVLFWMMVFVMATYLFSLGRQFIYSWSKAKEQEIATGRYKKAWQVLYNKESKRGKRKMDSTWVATW